MSLTLTELQEKLKAIDEISLMEALNITSEDIVMRFVDKIEEYFDTLVIDFEQDVVESFMVDDSIWDGDMDAQDLAINDWIDNENYNERNDD